VTFCNVLLLRGEGLLTSCPHSKPEDNPLYTIRDIFLKYSQLLFVSRGRLIHPQPEDMAHVLTRDLTRNIIVNLKYNTWWRCEL